jgi:hypothetical protein
VAIVRRWSGTIRGLCTMPGGQGMAGTGAIVRRTIVHLIRISGRFIVRLGLIRGIRVIGRLLMEVGQSRHRTSRARALGIRALVRRGMGIRALDRPGMGMGILALVLLETGMGILGRGLRGTGIRVLVRRGMGIRVHVPTSRVFSRRGRVIRVLDLLHRRSLRLGLRILAVVIRGKAGVRGRLEAVDKEAVVRGRAAVVAEGREAVRGRPVAVEGTVLSRVRSLLREISQAALLSRSSLIFCGAD